MPVFWRVCQVHSVGMRLSFWMQEVSSPSDTPKRPPEAMLGLTPASD